MIIEFVGIPGSGKTTLAKTLSKEKEYRYIETNFWYEKYLYFAQYVITHPIRLIQLFFQTIAQGMKTGSLRIMVYKLKILVSSIIANTKAVRLSRHETVVLDQGLAQYGLGLLEGELDESQAVRYIRSFVVADQIMFIQVDPNIAKERLQNRGNVPRKNLVGDWDSWYDKYVKRAEVFRRAGERAGVLTLVR